MTRGWIVMAACFVLAACRSSSLQPADASPHDALDRTPRDAGDAGWAEVGDDGAADTQVGVEAGNTSDAPASSDAPVVSDAPGPVDAVVDAVARDAVGAGDAVARSDACVPDDVCTISVAYQTQSPTLAVLPGRAGLFVVHAAEVVHVSRSGTVHGRLPWPREILAALWSSDRAVILDRGVLTTLGEQLETLGRINLMETCVQAVPIDRDRIVCGPANDWQRIFYTYEVTTPALVAPSQGITYEGIPMRRVPGRPWFLTQEALFTLTATGQATLRQDFGFGSANQPVLPLTFAGNPATHAVDRMGKVFQLQESCQPSCFAAAGAWTNTFVGPIIDGPAGSVLQTGVSGAKRLDVATGVAVSAGQVTSDGFANVVSAVHDPYCGVVTTVLSRFRDGLVTSVEQIPYEGFDGGVGP